MSGASMVESLSRRLKEDGCDHVVVDAALALDEEQLAAPFTGEMEWKQLLPFSQRKARRILQEFGHGTRVAFHFDVATLKLLNEGEYDRRLWCLLIGAGKTHYPERTVGEMRYSFGTITVSHML